MNVILIEDDPDIQFIYKRQLDTSDMPTDAFATGKEAYAALDAKQYEIALIDIMLPDTNGIEILKHIKQHQQMSHMVTIFLTNMGQDTVVQEGYKLGVDGYLIKATYTPGELIDEIKKIYDKKHQKPA